MNRKFLNSIFLLFTLICLTACDDDPIEDNDKPSGPEVVDYSQDENWMIRGQNTNYPIDVFYIYPTAYFPRDNETNPPLYCEIDNLSMRICAPAEYVLQARFFEDMANMYVPWYRQADALGVIDVGQEKLDAIVRALPYVDIRAAFDYYIKHFNQGRPFILTGDSQGSIVAKMLLEDYMADHPEVMERMIVSYPLGYSFEKSYFEKNKHLKFAEGETDTGVIACWNCERKVGEEFSKYNYVVYPGALCINPVTWTRDDELVRPRDPRYLGSKRYPLLNCSIQIQYDPKRQCEVLILGIDNDKFDNVRIGDKCLHGMDYSYFIDNIKENAKKRVKAYMEKSKL